MLPLALYYMLKGDIEISTSEFFDKSGRFFASKYTKPSHLMVKKDKDMDFSEDDIEIRKRLF